MNGGIKYILDIGSSSLRLVAVEMRQTRVIAEESVLYDGYLDGEFLTPEKLQNNLSELLTIMFEKLKKPIKEIYVGVPNDFCKCVCKRISRKFMTLHKISQKDLNELYSSSLNFDTEVYSVINYSPMQMSLDDNYTTLSPIKKKTYSLVLDASFILAKNSFISMFEEYLKSLGVIKTTFISTSLGQGLYCKQINNLNKMFAIVDVGHITTNVSVFKGEGLALMSSFSMGGGHISSDIMQILSMPFKEAELIKRKVILTIESEKNEDYIIPYKNTIIKSPINITNQIVKSRIEIIAKLVENVLSIDDVFKNLTIYLTGEGVCHYKGVKNIFKDVTNKEINLFEIPFVSVNEKYQTSKMGLICLTKELN